MGVPKRKTNKNCKFEVLGQVAGQFFELELELIRTHMALKPMPRVGSCKCA